MDGGGASIGVLGHRIDGTIGSDLNIAYACFERDAFLVDDLATIEVDNHDPF